MKILKYSLFALSAVLLMFLTVQCDVIDEGKLDNPNAVSPANVDPDFLLNNIQLSARGVYSASASLGAELTRMRYMFGSNYNNAYTSQSFNGLYQNTYSSLFIDVQNLLPTAEERDLFFHAGIAKTLQAYGMITMVDMYGDMPFAEALDPSNFNPNLDDGQGIYQAAISLLDEAIADLQNENRRAFPSDDLYFSNLTGAEKVAAWVRTANTIKMKAYLNTNSQSEFFALANSGNIISEPEHNFTFNYGLSDVNPDARHPLYGANYDDLAGAYMSVGYMNMLLNDKDELDPRMRYYFYRQSTSDTDDFNENRCINEFPPVHFDGNDPWCFPGGNGEGDGWWGRDHLINDGIPPDRGLRTTFGVYPVGGNFDSDQGASVEKGDGLAGAGIEPILMSFGSWFMIAEAEIRFNSNTVAAKEALEEAVKQSLNTVANFGSSLADGTGFEITDVEVDSYWAVVESRVDGAANNQVLRNVMKENYFALWPNGYEAYNAMRRTGLPDRQDNIQPTRTPSPGTWYRTLLYPANMVERNSNVSQKSSVGEGPFWDQGLGDFNF